MIPPTRENGGYYGRTMDAGQFIDWLSQFPRETPITVAIPPEDSVTGHRYHLHEWLNVTDLSDPRENDEFSIIIGTADDYDSRQW